jgi:hypothetical protein
MRRQPTSRRARWHVGILSVPSLCSNFGIKVKQNGRRTGGQPEAGRHLATPDAKTPLDNYGIHSAKSSGEPPLVLASSVFFAIKHAIMSARRCDVNA